MEITKQQPKTNAKGNVYNLKVVAWHETWDNLSMFFKRSKNFLKALWETLTKLFLFLGGIEIRKYPSIFVPDLRDRIILANYPIFWNQSQNGGVFLQHKFILVEHTVYIQSP